MKTALPLFAIALAAVAFYRPSRAEATTEDPSPGALLRITEGNSEPVPCPLEHTAVSVEISGPVSRVRVKQVFRNPLSTPLEALYTFPLSNRGAVDEMTIRINDRVVKGSIKRREEARRIYDAARAKGHLAGLLDQQRPNIFTQRLANIPAGARVEVEIAYVETLVYLEGQYEFTFPMTVGPRYKGASNPTYAAKGTRVGHNLSLNVKVDGRAVTSPTHEIVKTDTGIALRNQQEIPNKDFILRYRIATERIEDIVLANRTKGNGHFTLLLTPPTHTREEDVTPKELVFVIDTSGSMHGFPLDKAKEAMSAALAGLHPRDTFNLITFSGDTHLLFPKPVPATKENLRAAQQFLKFSQSGGGTEMMKAIRASLAPSDSQEHLRIVCFMTDGYVGNEPEILAEIQRHSNARVFSFGIGSSVNRHLLDEMSAKGRGEVEYVGLQDDGSAAAKRFHERVRSPLLTDVRIDWGGLPVQDLYPARLPDLFDAKPLVINGQYTGGGTGEIKILGNAGGKPFERRVRLVLPAAAPQNEAIPTLWARAKINAITDVEAITQLGLQYKLMTQYTSFVAVDESTVSDGNSLLSVEVPAQMPEGVSHDMVGASAPGGSRGRYMPSPILREEARKSMPATESEPKAARAENMDTLLAARVQQAGPTDRIGVRVYLREVNETVLAALKKLGLTILDRPGNAKLIIGEIDASKMAALTKMAAVQHVTLR